MIVLSKLQPPEIRTKTLERERLIEALSRNLDKKVILLCAGAGYGKTTLLSHFLNRTGVPAVYYHLESSDGEPAVFFSYLVAGMQKLNPAFGKKVAQLRHLLNQPQRYSDLVSGTFLNEVMELIKGDTYVILEDYQSLRSSTQISRVLNYCFKNMPPNLHFVITSRTEPDLYVALMRARDEFFELSTEQLRFTKEEIRRLYRSVYARPLSREDLEWVARYSEGWPVSLRLMLQATHHVVGIDSTERERARSVIAGYLRSPAGLFNYFAQEIYYQEPPRVRRFLVECSLFEWLDPELCNAATGRRNAPALLAELARRNAFVFSIPEHGYRLHNLFREFLFSKFEDAKRRKAICVRAADFLARARKYGDAINYYLKARAHQKASAVIDKAGPDFIGQGRCGALAAYIEQIPAPVRERNPDLLIIYAQALNILGRLEEARLNLLKALRTLKERSVRRGRQADVLYALGGISTTEGKFASAMRYYRQALRVCPRGANLTRASILNSLGSLHTARGGRYLAGAVRFYEEALAIARRKGYGGIEASILNNWAMNEWKTGDLNAAHAKISRIAGVLAQHFTPGCGAGFYNAAKISLLVGQEQEAEAILDSGRETCGPYDDLWSLVVLWTGYGLLYMARGDLEKAREHVSRALQAAEKLGVERLIVVALTELCKIGTEMRDYAEAEQAISRIWLLKKESDDAESIPAHLAEGRLRIGQGKYDHAGQKLAHARSLAMKVNDVFHQFLVNLESSRLFYLTGDTERCAAALREAIRLSREKGYDHLLTVELARQPWMVQSVRERDIEPGYVRALLERSKTGMHWLEAHLFGPPRVSVDGRPIDDGQWPTVKTKKLLFYLLQHRSEKMSGDRLIDALWPAAPATKGGASLRKAMQHIRDVAGSVLGNRAEFVSGGRGLYEIAPAISVELDTHAFDALCRKARASKDDTERLDLLNRAITISGNDLAAGWYDDWVEDLRQYYHGKHEECLVMMAELRCRREEYEEAAEVCAALVGINPLEESYQRRYMEVLARLGQYAEVERIFARLKKDLKRELRAEPHRKTVELYETLMRSAAR